MNLQVLKPRFRPLLGLLLAGTISGGSIAVAQADSSESALGAFGPVAGYSYYTYAAVYNGPPVARTSVQNQFELYSVPTGYMLALAALYKNTLLCDATDYATNDVPARQLIEDTGGGGCGTGYYHSRGTTGAYNGSSYELHYTFPTSQVFE